MLYGSSERSDTSLSVQPRATASSLIRNLNTHHPDLTVSRFRFLIVLTAKIEISIFAVDRSKAIARLAWKTTERSLFLTHPTKWGTLTYDINLKAKIK
ncbi:hypothetical protein LC593_27475 [Nostoc sp. CHAB 5844]|nr:hypothetical protein [Nostoc sp. CHAB 5844]